MRLDEVPTGMCAAGQKGGSDTSGAQQCYSREMKEATSGAGDKQKVGCPGVK